MAAAATVQNDLPRLGQEPSQTRLHLALNAIDAARKVARKRNMPPRQRKACV